MQKVFKFAKTIAVAALLLSASSVAGQHRHYITAWGAAGYANFLHEVENTSSWGGPGGLLGIGYEYNYKRFIVTIGTEFDFKNSSVQRDDFSYQLGMTDTEGTPFTFNYDFTKYWDTYNIGYVNVPLLLGAQFKNKMYFLVGGKFGLQMLGFANMNSHIRTTGIYERLKVPLQDMPNHFFTDVDLQSTNPVALNFNVAASLEIGRIIYPSKKKSRFHYRIAAFADYGVLNVNMNNVLGDGNIIRIPREFDNSSNVLNVQMNSLFTSQQIVNVPINPLLVGVKFTVLFDLGEKEPCHCLPDYNSRWNRGRRR